LTCGSQTIKEPVLSFNPQPQFSKKKKELVKECTMDCDSFKKLASWISKLHNDLGGCA
jgi:hypothetical protein